MGKKNSPPGGRPPSGMASWVPPGGWRSRVIRERGFHALAVLLLG